MLRRRASTASRFAATVDLALVLCFLARGYTSSKNHTRRRGSSREGSCKMFRFFEQALIMAFNDTPLRQKPTLRRRYSVLGSTLFRNSITKIILQILCLFDIILAMSQLRLFTLFDIEQSLTLLTFFVGVLPFIIESCLLTQFSTIRIIATAS